MILNGKIGVNKTDINNMSLGNDLNKAIIIASHAHENQWDRGGQPYILHPLRVMLKVSQLEEKITAVLHDTVEDTDLTLDDIEKTFGLTIRDAVDSVSRRNHCSSKHECNWPHGCHCECIGCKTNETYNDFIKRAYMNPIGRVVKIADIKDNLDINRPGSVDFLAKGICKRYYEALQFLEGN
jgi:(p)ppGpp synthase/HD superfamily hydrolase